MLHPRLFAAVQETGELPRNADAAQILAFAGRVQGSNATALKIAMADNATLLPKLKQAYDFAARSQIETDQVHRPEVEHLTPRLSDAFNSFLADIAPAAFEKRGILDIVRDELATRAVFVLGDKAFSDILITEFRIQ